MGFWDTVSRFTTAAVRALPPCHICGAPGAQVCVACGKVGCHRHSYSNIAAVRSVCSLCMSGKFDWAKDDLRRHENVPEDWPYNEAPWELLGIPYAATEDEIRHAQRELSKVLHPDKETGDTDRQIAVNRAAEVMLNIRRGE